MFKFINFILHVHNVLIQRYYSFKYRKFSSLKNKDANVFLSEAGIVKLNAKDEQKAERVYYKAKDFLRKHINDPEKVLRYIDKNATKVVRMRYADKVFTFLNIAPGFLPKQTGIQTLCLSVCIRLFSKTRLPIGFSLPDMFVLGEQTPNIYLLSHQFHHWLAYKAKLPGYDPKTQENFKNIWKLQKSSNIKRLSIEEILSLKDAIARDIDAIDMVKELAIEFSGQKQCLEKMRLQGSSVV